MITASLATARRGLATRTGCVCPAARKLPTTLVGGEGEGERGRPLRRLGAQRAALRREVAAQEQRVDGAGHRVALLEQQQPPGRRAA
jgi:hypothetical protein